MVSAMRTKIIRSVIAAASLAVGLAAGAASVTAAAQPASAPPDIDLDALMAVLTPDQMVCLATNSMNVDPDDVTAVFGVLEECDIDIADLMTAAGGTGADIGTGIGEVVSSLAAIGIDEVAEACIASAVAVTPPADDNAALEILRGCDVSLLDVVTLIGGGSVGAGPDVSTGTPSVGSDNPLVAQMAAELANEFPNLDEAQLTCFATEAVDNLAAFMAEDVTTIMAALTACDIPLTAIL